MSKIRDVSQRELGSCHQSVGAEHGLESRTSALNSQGPACAARHRAPRKEGSPSPAFCKPPLPAVPRGVNGNFLYFPGSGPLSGLGRQKYSNCQQVTTFTSRTSYPSLRQLASARGSETHWAIKLASYISCRGMFSPKTQVKEK